MRGSWPLDTGETSTGGTRETGPSSLKGFPSHGKGGILCVYVCILKPNAPCELNPERNVCSAEKAHARPFRISKQSPSQVLPQVEAAPGEASTSEKSFNLPDAPGHERSQVCQGHYWKRISSVLSQELDFLGRPMLSFSPRPFSKNSEYL